MTTQVPRDVPVPLIAGSLATLFAGGTANVTVHRALEGLSAEDAVKVPSPLPHSVAQLLAHMAFWQTWLLRVVRGERPGWPEHAAEGWPDVPQDAYEPLKASFLADLEALQSLARTDEFVASVTDAREPRAWANSLLSFAAHNVYHVGQIVLTRRALGAWPPPSGGDSW